MGMTRSLTNSCLFFLNDKEGKPILIVLCHVDNTTIAGRPQQIEHFKFKLWERFNIKELGQLNKHLGIKYEWINNSDGRRIKATMDDLQDKIVQLVKERKMGPLRLHNTPAKPKTHLFKNKGPIIDQKLYQTVVGKIM